MTEVFILKSLKQVTEGRAKEPQTEESKKEVENGLTVLAKQESVAASLSLGVAQADFSAHLLELLSNTLH